MSTLPHRRLGSSDLHVSLFSLGSWRTFERISREQGLAVMHAAREVGITFLDDARYNDETGDAPIPTGYSEVVFGELFRSAGWVRDEVVVANKLWWEFWPEQDAKAELDGSLGRMRLDHVDLIYAMPPPEGVPMHRVIGELAGLVTSGRARAWGIGNWPVGLLASAIETARSMGAPLPVAAQLPYSLVRTDWVEDPAMEVLLEPGDIGLVASYVLAGGTLSGKYLRSAADGRGGGRSIGGRAAADTSSVIAAGKDRAAAVVVLAEEWGVPAASLAFAFVLEHPRLSSVLFGATSPEQVRENVMALDVYRSLDDTQRARLAALAPGR
jgi:aryl-alcohol dehydrogenase-like predicted oxidoreductase